jgi:hypothetical protein
MLCSLYEVGAGGEMKINGKYLFVFSLFHDAISSSEREVDRYLFQGIDCGLLRCDAV